MTPDVAKLNINTTTTTTTTTTTNDDDDDGDVGEIPDMDNYQGDDNLVDNDRVLSLVISLFHVFSHWELH